MTQEGANKEGKFKDFLIGEIGSFQDRILAECERRGKDCEGIEVSAEVKSGNSVETEEESNTK